MPLDELITSVQQLSAKELEKLLQKRQADDKALRTLWRAALAREREERRQAREEADNASL
jgi:Arc/MetJ family transcription regulator